jgi:DNA-directed RNA polymerase subunit H
MEEIQEIFKSRNTILNLSERQDYNIEKYSEIGFSEVESMYKTKQLDMLLEDSQSNKKVYIKYHLAKTLRPANIYDYIEDLFNIDDILKQTDTLIIIMKDEPNDTIKKILKHIFERDKIFIIVFNIKRLLFNVLDHYLVPHHKVLTNEEANKIKKKYFIKNDDELPDIDRFGPVSQAIGIRPGEICEITRNSKTSIENKFYRICSQ